MPLAANDALPMDSQLLQYRLLRQLGQGGFGITYLARDTRLDMPVAIKEFFPLDLAVRETSGVVRAKTQSHEAQFLWGMERFLQEARTLARFRHANIVRVQNFFEANQTAYMVMEYEEGESLSETLKRLGRPDEAFLRRITLPLLDGLAALHAAGFIHRDIKPGNIYLRRDQTPVLLDFGAARHAVGEQTKTLTAFLTPGYAPFEQYYSKSDKQGPWTDIYALGGVLYRAVTGEPPCHATDRSSALLGHQPDPLTPAVEAGRGRYSQEFLAAIDTALRVLEKERPQSVADWRACFVADNATAAPDTPTEAIPLPPARKSGRWKKAVVGVLLLLAALGGARAWKKSHRPPAMPVEETARQPVPAAMAAETAAPTSPPAAAPSAAPTSPPAAAPPAAPAPVVAEKPAPPPPMAVEKPAPAKPAAQSSVAPLPPASVSLPGPLGDRIAEMDRALTRAREKVAQNPSDRAARQELEKVGRGYLNLAGKLREQQRYRIAEFLMQRAALALPERELRGGRKAGR